MYRLILAAIVLLPIAAYAQQSPPIALAPDLAIRVDGYLRSGGTHAEGVGLALELENAAQAPKREAAIQKRISDAVEQAKKAPGAPQP